MPERNYNQNCALARGTDLLGERWTLLIVRDLLIAPRRFTELEARLSGMGSNLLAKRLKDMLSVGLIVGGGVRMPYRLTPMGRALEPMVLHLVRWSLTWVESAPKQGGLHFPDWDLLALKSLFIPDQKMRKPLLARFECEGWVAWVKVNHQEFIFGLGEPDEQPDLVLPYAIPALRNPDRAFAGMNSSMKHKVLRLLACFSKP